jgi:hypothetical protein
MVENKIALFIRIDQRRTVFGLISSITDREVNSRRLMPPYGPHDNRSNVSFDEAGDKK